MSPRLKQVITYLIALGPIVIFLVGILIYTLVGEKPEELPPGSTETSETAPGGNEETRTSREEGATRGEDPARLDRENGAEGREPASSAPPPSPSREGGGEDR